MYIYGRNVAREKLNSNEKINKAIISTKFKDQEIIDIIKKKKIKINFVEPKVLDNKVNGLHQGIILEIDNIKTYSLEEVLLKINKHYKTLVMLDHLEDPHNLGAIIRTSEALGVDGIIIPSDRSVQVNATVIKTSAGATSYLPIIKVPNLNVAIKKLKKNDFWIIGTDMQGEDYSKLNYNMNICLIIGNEGKGMSNVVTKDCDFIAKIPMTGKINSLNASVSCGIFLSMIVNKRNNI